ncbi:hypothetical protein ES332_A13G189900v1 [Gossypium tomentosum]|uniref:Uncharacterized protein n=1 Tax=Gossypium tomentosum TaxID=34277 RepID=A0A5D2MMA3_GOSTO|nr:hypothetical protein ES332_A13G189900v1 [Gossypium tomentosum]
MKNSQVSVQFFMLVLLFSAGHSCSEEIKLPSWKIPDCSSLCKTRHGVEMKPSEFILGVVAYAPTPAFLLKSNPLFI